MGMLEGQIRLVIGVDTTATFTPPRSPTRAARYWFMPRWPAPPPGTGNFRAWRGGMHRTVGCGRWRARAASVPG
jgi:hypothetical protein